MRVDTQREHIALIDDAPEAYVSRRATETLFARAKIGPVFYSLAVIFSALPQGLFQTHLAVVLAFLTPLLVVAVLRLSAPKPSAEDTASWHRRHWLLVYSCVLIWGAYFGWVSMHPDWTSAFIVSLICTVNFSTAIAHQFCIDKRNATLCSLLCFMWASVVIVLYRPELIAILYAFAFYCLYLVSTIKNANAEFFRKLDIELKLIATQRELDNQASTDALTGLANRRVYDAEMQRNYSLAKRHNTDFSLILLDLDHFKSLNDSHGHATGDLCIKAVASLLTDVCRRELDIIARIGGEEFAIILPETPQDEAYKLACNIHERFQHLEIENNQATAIVVTASIGVGSFLETGSKDINVLYQLTDAAVYKAKQEGRNQIGVAHVAPETQVQPATVR